MMSFKLGFSGLFAIAIMFTSVSGSLAQSEAGTESGSEAGGVPLTTIPAAPAPSPTPAAKPAPVSSVQSSRSYSAVKKTTVKPKVVNYHLRTRTRTSTTHR